MVDKLKRFCGECGSKLPTVVDPGAPTECQNAYCESTSREVYAFCIDELFVVAVQLNLCLIMLAVDPQTGAIHFIYAAIVLEACTTIRSYDDTRLGF